MCFRYYARDQGYRSSPSSLPPFTCLSECGVVQCDGVGSKGVFQYFRIALLEEQPAAEPAPLIADDSEQRMASSFSVLFSATITRVQLHVDHGAPDELLSVEFIQRIQHLQFSCHLISLMFSAGSSGWTPTWTESKVQT